MLRGFDVKRKRTGQNTVTLVKIMLLLRIGALSNYNYTSHVYLICHSLNSLCISADSCHWILKNLEGLMLLF